MKDRETCGSCGRDWDNCHEMAATSIRQLREQVEALNSKLRIVRGRLREAEHLILAAGEPHAALAKHVTDWADRRQRWLDEGVGHAD